MYRIDGMTISKEKIDNATESDGKKIDAAQMATDFLQSPAVLAAFDKTENTTLEQYPKIPEVLDLVIATMQERAANVQIVDSKLLINFD